MKYLLAFVLLTISTTIKAQNYEIVKTSTISSFIDTSNFIHEFVVDSFYTIGNDTVYNSFKRTRKFDTCFAEIEAPIFGKSIIKRQNGLYQIVNAEYDTLLINTSAQVGDTWQCFTNLTNKYIEAECTQIIFEDVLGTMDSVKTIQFTLKDNSNNTINSKINSLHLKISKNFGLISMVDFALFPFIDVNTNYYSPNFQSNQNAYSQLEIESINDDSFVRVDKLKSHYYNFEVGDFMQIFQDNQIISFEGIFPDEFERTYTDYEIIDKTINTTSTIYKVFFKISNTKGDYDDGVNKTYSQGIKYWTIGHEELITDKRFYKDSYTYRYNNSHNFTNTSYLKKDTSRDVLYKTSLSITPSDASGDHNPCSKTSHTTHSIEGLGSGYGSYSYGGLALWYSFSKTLIYYRKGNIEEGTYVPIGIDKIEKNSKKISIFPNPNNGDFNVAFNNNNKFYSIEILDNLGSIISTTKTNKKNTFINSELDSGIYFVKISNGNNIFVKRFIIH